MVTIYDIAKEAKVSSATVSRVLNDGQVSPRTKKRVLRAIKKLGYIPDNRAVYLKKEKTKKVGLIIPDISNPVYPIGVRVIHDILKSHGYHLILGNTYGEISEEKDLLEMMQRERVAGIILATCEGEDDSELFPIFRRFLENNISLVFMGKKKDDLPVDIVSVNNLTGALKATEYLLRTGREKIGFIAGGRDSRVTKERLEGYLEAFKKKNTTPSSELIICDGEYTMEYGERWGELLLKNYKPDAIFCANDLLAIGVIKACEKLNMEIPEEVAVVGFDDIYLASLVNPKLTTIHQPLGEIATIACEILVERIERGVEEEPREILIEPELIVRESA